MSAPGIRYVTLLASLAALVVLLAANARYVYSDDLDRLPRLTAAHVADPRYAGSTFLLEGQVESAGASTQGILFFGLHQPEHDLNITVPVFPSVGSPAVRPRRGDRVRVTGNLGMYRGQPQLKPLSADHVQVVGRSADTGAAAPIRPWDRSDGAVPLGAAATAAGETLLVGPLAAVEVEPFTSRAGRRHLRLTLADGDSTVQGIAYEGDWSDAHADLLASGAFVVVTAEISEYRGQPSLVVKQIHSVD